MAVNLPVFSTTRVGKPCGGKGAPGNQSLRLPPTTPSPGRDQASAAKYKRVRPDGCRKEGNDTATLQRPSPLPPLPSPWWPSLPNLIFATQGLASLHRGPIRRPARGEKPKQVDKIPGLRKRKGSQTLTLAYFPAFRKITAPNPSQSSLPPHESLGRLLLVSNLEK